MTPGTGLRLERFLFAPPDLRTADPTMAADIYAGLFVFAGRVVDTHGLSPFDIAPPSRAWSDALHGFGWLRHMQSAGSQLARDNARSLIVDFLGRGRPAADGAHAPGVVARRLMSFLAHSSFMLAAADHDFYELYLDAVQKDAARLRDSLQVIEDPGARLTILIALTLLGLATEGGERLERRFGAQLASEIEAQIGPDGGHVSRNPRVLIDLMLDLLPVKSTYSARGMDAPPELLGAMDRIVPHLRMLRHPDGSVALFNGMGPTQVDALATIFASHDVSGRVLADAPYAGYARLEAGSTVLLADTGSPPPFAASGDGMAGCGSFEFSHARQRLIVNCGVPLRVAASLPVELRGSAAHSMATLDDLPVCAFLERGAVTRIIEGPRKVSVSRGETETDIHLSIAHDGYGARHGLIATREVSLAPDGLMLTGRDGFAPAQGRAASTLPRLARFHLHPGVSAAVADEAVLVVPPVGPAWVLTAEGADLAVEDSMYFAGVDGPRRTLQIVLRFRDGVDAVAWCLEARDRPTQPD